MVFVEEAAELVTAMLLAAVVSRMVWAQVEAALVAADQPMTAESPVMAALLLEVQRVDLQAVLPPVRSRQPVALLRPALQVLLVLALAASGPPQVAEPCLTLLMARKCHRDLLAVAEVLGSLLARLNFRWHLLLVESVPLSGQGEVRPDLLLRSNYALQMLGWLGHWLAEQGQCVLEPRRLMPVRKNPCPGPGRHRFPESIRMDPELSQRKILVSCLCPESPAVFVASA